MTAYLCGNTSFPPTVWLFSQKFCEMEFGMMDEPDKSRVVTQFVSEEEEDDADDDGNDDDADDTFSHPLQKDVSTQVAALSVLLSPVTTPFFHTAGRQNLFVFFFFFVFFPPFCHS